MPFRLYFTLSLCINIITPSGTKITIFNPFPLLFSVTESNTPYFCVFCFPCSRTYTFYFLGTKVKSRWKQKLISLERTILQSLRNTRLWEVALRSGKKHSIHFWDDASVLWKFLFSFSNSIPSVYFANWIGKHSTLMFVCSLTLIYK